MGRLSMAPICCEMPLGSDDMSGEIDLPVEVYESFCLSTVQLALNTWCWVGFGQEAGSDCARKRVDKMLHAPPPPTHPPTHPPILYMFCVHCVSISFGVHVELACARRAQHVSGLLSSCTRPCDSLSVGQFHWHQHEGIRRTAPERTAVTVTVLSKPEVTRK